MMRGLTPLSRHIAALFDGNPESLPAAPRAAFAAAQRLASELLQSAAPPVALHGDLHHDNVLKGARGWCAIDAKGLLGDPDYETANAFRNPKRAEALAQTPGRIAEMATLFALRLRANPRCLIRWAAAHCAVSLAWSMASGPAPEADLTLLPILLDAAD